MKATDLMIGDWVRMPFGLPEIRQIKYPSEIDDADFYEPIPLTAEILEKNGFNIEIAPYTPYWKRCILNPNFFLEDRLKGFYHFNGNNLAKIQYVHELQHALRLCGITREIII